MQQRITWRGEFRRKRKNAIYKLFKAIYKIAFSMASITRILCLRFNSGAFRNLFYKNVRIKKNGSVPGREKRYYLYCS